MNAYPCMYTSTDTQRNRVIQCTTTTAHRKILAGEKLVNLANRKLFTKIFLINIHRYIENAFCICTDCSLFVKIFLANSIVWQNFLPPNISHVWYMWEKLEG